MSPPPNRSKLFITTKIHAGSGAVSDCAADPQLALKSVRSSLKNLGVEYLDMVLLHRPCQQVTQNCLWNRPEMRGCAGEFGRNCFGPAAMSESAATAGNNALWRGLEQAVAQGLVRSIGVSNYSPAELAALHGTVPAVNQCEMSVEGADNATLAYCKCHDIRHQSYGAVRGCPFAADAVTKAARNHGVSPAQVCLRWTIDKGALAAAGVGTNSSTVAQYAKENLGVESFALIPTEVAALDNLQLGTRTAMKHDDVAAATRPRSRQSRRQRSAKTDDEMHAHLDLLTIKSNDGSLALTLEQGSGPAPLRMRSVSVNGTTTALSNRSGISLGFGGETFPVSDGGSSVLHLPGGGVGFRRSLAAGAHTASLTESFVPVGSDSLAWMLTINGTSAKLWSPSISAVFEVAGGASEAGRKIWLPWSRGRCAATSSATCDAICDGYASPLEPVPEACLASGPSVSYGYGSGGSMSRGGSEGVSVPLAALLDTASDTAVTLSVAPAPNLISVTDMQMTKFSTKWKYLYLFPGASIHTKLHIIMVAF
jgi:diketogulonate reductase-like aldo/keto reductase